MLRLRYNMLFESYFNFLGFKDFDGYHFMFSILWPRKIRKQFNVNAIAQGLDLLE
jgi:hypothetical protein